MSADLGTEAIDHAMIRDGLRRIGHSPILGGSPQLLAFLAFVTEETLAGRGATLKAYTIATLALGRGADFDPQRDAIVRTEARRLRLALDRYYAGPGRLDPVRITLPLGSYVPRFSSGHGRPSAALGPCARDVVVPRDAYLDFVARFLLGAHLMARPGGWLAGGCPARAS